MAERIVKKAKEYDRDTIPGDYATLTTPCPNCGGVVKENYRRYACTGSRQRRRAAERRQAAASRSARSRAAAPSSSTRSSASSRDKKIGPLEGFRSKAGWPFTAELKLAYDDEIKQLEARVRLRRGREEATASRGEPVDFSGQESLGPCPKDAGPRLRARHQLRLRARGRRATSPATSRAARSSCSSRWRASR